MRELLITLATCLCACAHDKLDFSLPDAGRSHSTQRVRDAGEFGRSACSNQGLCLGDAGPDGDGDAAIADGSETENGHDQLGDPDAASNQSPGSDDIHRSDPVDTDPNGYPTPPGQRAPWCDEGEPIDEVCGNGVDDDCDGTVDEFMGVGEPCRTDCGKGIHIPGFYVCDAVTNSLVCQPSQPDCIVTVPNPPRCGDIVVDPGEQCDPGNPRERAGITCTLDCKRPLFVQCLINGELDPDVCDDLHACNERIGACVPVIGPNQPRCPEVPIGDSTDKFYPMLETEGGQCWVTCLDSEQCPSPISDCYMGFCAVPL